jgi:hypothetical protein
MLNVTENDIHLYVLNKSLLSNEVIEEIEKRISSDSNFNIEVNEVKEFYEIYERLERADKECSLILKPIYTDETTNNLRLAAQHNSIDEKLKYIKTFASDENLIITRLLYNPVQKEYELYILYENDITKVSNAVVRFLSNNKEFVADKNGIVRIKADFINDKTNIKVNLPVARFEIKPDFISAGEVKKHISKIANYEVEINILIKDEVAECRLQFLSGDPELSGELKAYIFNSEDVEHFEAETIVDNLFHCKYREEELLNILIINDIPE